ncbi:MAG: cytochrome-c peroxidase [Bacteroidetes bacterium]|nr:cytochrome-c peroxidase [Bacteroidota bacterium]
MKKAAVSFFLLVLLCAFNLRRDSLFPDYWPEPRVSLSLDSQKIALGRFLFYDPILSRDSSVSCESCHSPYSSFTHIDHALSHGIDNQIGTRNAPALFNLAWQSHFMWDGIANSLQEQNTQPILNPIEMDGDMDFIIRKLKRSDHYRELFAKAFRVDAINEAHLLEALSEFQLTLISANSKYDQVMAGKAEFNEMERKGYEIFKTRCNSCHTEPLFSTYAFANNGLPADTALNDLGRYSLTLNPKDSFLFKIPSLRNLKYTFPYMHDGRFTSLYQVLDHYQFGIAFSTTLAPVLKNGIHLSSNERTELVAFLLTLSDEAFVFKPEHAAPRN